MNDTATPELRPFNAWLLEQRNGALHGELTEKLAEVVQAAVEHGKKGKLTLIIEIQPDKDLEAVFVRDEIKPLVPQPARGTALYHTDEAGNMTRNNPRQPELPLREVPRDISAAKEISS